MNDASLGDLIKLYGNTAIPAGIARQRSDLGMQRGQADLAEVIASTGRRNDENMRAQQKHPLEMEGMGLENQGRGIDNTRKSFDNTVRQGLGPEHFQNEARNKLSKEELSLVSQKMELLPELASELDVIPPAARAARMQELAVKYKMDPQTAQGFFDLLTKEPDAGPQRIRDIYKESAKLKDSYLRTMDKQELIEKSRAATEQERTRRAMAVAQLNNAARMQIAQIKDKARLQSEANKLSKMNHQQAFNHYLRLSTDTTVNPEDRRRYRDLAEIVQAQINHEKALAGQPYGSTIMQRPDGSYGIETTNRPQQSPAPQLPQVPQAPQQQPQMPQQAPQPSPGNMPPRQGAMSLDDYLRQNGVQ